MNERLERFLAERRARYDIVPHAGGVTAQEQSAVAHVSGWSLAKVVIVKERDGFVMAVLPACTVLDLDRLKGLIGHGDIRLATLEEARAVVPDCVPGAIPPFGTLFGVRSFVDGALLAAARVTMPAGDLATAIRMSTAEFRRVMDGRIGDFAVPEALAGRPFPRISGRRRRVAFGGGPKSKTGFRG